MSKNQVVLNDYSWFDKCNKKTYGAWTIPPAIKQRGAYKDSTKRKFCVSFLDFSYIVDLQISSGEEISFPASLKKLVSHLIGESNGVFQIKFEALDIPGLEVQTSGMDYSVEFSEENREGFDVFISGKARQGHENFKKSVHKYWEGKCAVSGIENFPNGGFLISSHILPWSISDGKQKIDPFNGLLLTPNLDKFFDKGLISFSDDGDLLYKEEIKNLLLQTGIDLNSKLRKIDKQHKPFLKLHRELFEF